MYRRIYKTGMNFWAVLGRRGCREQKRGLGRLWATFWGEFFSGEKTFFLGLILFWNKSVIHRGPYSVVSVRSLSWNRLAFAQFYFPTTFWRNAQKLCNGNLQQSLTISIHHKNSRPVENTELFFNWLKLSHLWIPSLTLHCFETLLYWNLCFARSFCIIQEYPIWTISHSCIRTPWLFFTAFFTLFNF